MLVDGREIGGRERAVATLEDEDQLRAGGVPREAAFEKLLADHAGIVARKKTNVVVLRHLFPGRSVEEEQGRRDQPENQDDPRSTLNQAGEKWKHGRLGFQRAAVGTRSA